MALTERATRAAPYLQQLLRDPELQHAIRRTVGATRDAYARAQNKSPREAVKDKKLRRQLQQAVGAGREVWTAFGQPPRRKRRRRLSLTAVSVGGAGAFVAANPHTREKALKLLGKKDAKTADPLD